MDLLQELRVSLALRSPDSFQGRCLHLVAGGEQGPSAPAQHKEVYPSPPPALPRYLFVRKYSSRSPSSLS